MHAHLHASLTFCLVIIGLVIVISTMTPTITRITSAKAQLHGFAATATAITATAIAGPSSSSPSSSSGNQFSARLTGDNEVHPVDTDATGRIRLTVNSQQDALGYQISLSNSHRSSYS